MLNLAIIDIISYNVTKISHAYDNINLIPPYINIILMMATPKYRAGNIIN